MPALKTKLTPEQKQLDTDLWIILATTLVALGLYMGFQGPVVGFIKGNAPVLLRTLTAAAFQFGVAGLGITAVSMLRGENLLSYGLRGRNALLSILLCVLCFVPNLIFTFATRQADGYLPFQSVWTTRELLASGFPVNATGMLLTALVWGGFEGFNYVVICEKINRRFPSRRKWLNCGAVACAAACILIHGAVGVTFKDFAGMLTVFFIVYGMLTAKEYTGNAWGCIFVFVFLWNAY